MASPAGTSQVWRAAQTLRGAERAGNARGRSWMVSPVVGIEAQAHQNRRKKDKNLEPHPEQGTAKHAENHEHHRYKLGPDVMFSNERSNNYRLPQQ
jgi:hypothetical protein